MASTVLIVDDHESFRSVARELLTSFGYRVVGEADDGASTLVAARDLRPDLILLDVQLPDADGFEVTRRLTASGIGSAVVLVSSREARTYGKRLEASSALGFIYKGDLTAERIAAFLPDGG
ncbi:MAG: response regulator transcription factor [Actinomycetota bacterium]